MAIRYPFQPWRYPFRFARMGLTQPAAWMAFFLLPQMDGFRVDVLSERVVWLGQSHPFGVSTLGWVPVAFFAGVLAIGLASMVWGRLFCGWACPHNTMTEWTRPLRRWIGIEPKSRRQRRWEAKHPAFRIGFILLSLGLAFVWSAFASWLLVSFFVPPEWALHQWFAGGRFQPVLALVQGLITVVGLFLLYAGHHFCRACCPYGMAQGMSAYLEGKPPAMEIRFRAPDLSERCGPCHGCRDACPVALDPRTFTQKGAKLGFFDGCFNCGECIDACTYIQGVRRAGPGLLGFRLFPATAKKSAAAAGEMRRGDSGEAVAP